VYQYISFRIIACFLLCTILLLVLSEIFISLRF